MAQNSFSISGRRAPAMRAAAALLVCAGLAGWAGAAAAEGAEGTAGATLRMDELERAFWACDHAVTVGRIDVGIATTCSTLYEALKQRKFSGDFNQMLAWWRLNKEAEHQALRAPAPTTETRSATLRGR